MEKLENTTIEKYIHGDFDKDGTKNIDDPKPFDKKDSKYPEQNKSKFYLKSRYGGGEVLLSDELKALENSNNEKSKLLKTFLNENPGSFGRIKTVPSTMKKLRERHLEKLGDIAGATILTQNRKEAYEKAKKIEKKYTLDPEKTDDYYRNPKASHYALHYGIINPKKPSIQMELQIKSKKMNELDKKVHPYYKKGIVPKKFISQAKKLFKSGF